MKYLSKKFTSLLVALMALTLLLVACGDPTATSAPASTTAATTTAVVATTTAAPVTTAAVATTTAAAVTTAAVPATTTAAVATGAGISIDVNGSKVAIKPGEGKKFEPKGEVTVTIWSSQTKVNGERFAALIKEFETANPKIKVKVDNFNDTATYAEINKKLAAAATAGGMPNIATGYENWVPAFVDAKVALGLNKFISGPNGLTQKELEDYRPNMLSRGIFPQYANEIYTWVFSNSGPVLYYNEDLLKQSGAKTPTPEWTWDDLITASKLVTEKSGGKASGMVFRPKTVSEMVAGIFSRGGTVFDYAGNKFILTDKASTDHINMYYQGVKDGYFATADPNVQFDDQNKFIKQQSAFYISSTSSRSFVAAELVKPENKPFVWNATVIPHSQGLKPVTTLYGGATLGFKGKTEEEDQATWEVMKFMGSAAFQAKWASSSGYVPATKSTIDDPIYKAFLDKAPENKIPLIVYDYANASEPRLGQWEQVRNAFDKEIDALFQGQTSTVQEALKKIEDQANATLKK